MNKIIFKISLLASVNVVKSHNTNNSLSSASKKAFQALSNSNSSISDSSESAKSNEIIAPQNSDEEKEESHIDSLFDIEKIDDKEEVSYQNNTQASNKDESDNESSDKNSSISKELFPKNKVGSSTLSSSKKNDSEPVENNSSASKEYLFFYCFTSFSDNILTNNSRITLLTLTVISIICLLFFVYKKYSHSINKYIKSAKLNFNKIK